MIIPEGGKDKHCISSGKPNEVSHIPLLQEMLDYASQRGCVVLYLTTSYGVVSEESIIGDSSLKLGSLSRENFNRWNLLIGEEIVRACVEYNTNKVFLMCKEYRRYQKLIEEVKSRGISLQTPLLGKSEKLRKEVLLG